MRLNVRNHTAAKIKQGMFLLIIALTLLASNAYSQVSVNCWKDNSNEGSSRISSIDITPSVSRTVYLDTKSMQNALNSAISENSVTGNKKSNVIVSIPFPDGSNKDFYAIESSIMAPGLAAKYPQIKTYIITSADGSASSGRIDFTQFGFHAIIFTTDGTVYVDPVSRQDDKIYFSYYKKDFVKAIVPDLGGSCVVDNPAVRKRIEQKIANGVKTTSNYLKTYRLALAATAEYTNYYGGTIAGALSGMITTMNRVNAVYEKELSIRMVLIPNDTIFIYKNSATDPYTNDDGEAMLDQNQTTIDSAIGNASYDIGHVFSTGGGGIAILGAVCYPGYKAQGVTGGPAPIGDPFDIDYVAHEMGHQFGASHTFNSVKGSCGGGNRNASTAYENGSGSTIMAYAGICSPSNTQAHSDDYFHAISLEEINAYTTTDVGNSCAVLTAIDNLNPVVTNVGVGGFYIPISTPFVLTGSATDPNGDSLKYCWEEFDLGPSGEPNSPKNNAPIFRSFNPTSSPTRIFPSLSDILNNKQTMGEILPTYSRTLTFLLTVRDNKAGGGLTANDTIQFFVTSAAGPFKVTYPNANVSLSAGSHQTVKWNVAGTDTSLVKCASVNILFSSDGGLTFPVTLASKTPNDGSEEVIIPSTITTSARIKVEAADNIFFDVSDTNFTITASTVPVELVSFQVLDVKKGVHIGWSTATEVNNKGFYLERSADKKNYQNISFVTGKGTTTEKSSYEFTDNTVSAGKYSYRLKQVDNDGSYTYSNTIDVLYETVKAFTLEQNHPNPFNPSTMIVYSLKENQQVVLKVFNVLGSEIATLVNEFKPAGKYQVEFNQPGLPSGLYFYQLTAGGKSVTKKMMMLK